ncbi:hypothetical protein MBLNU230_g1372t1 [Neophaeotheca triangularis]
MATDTNTLTPADRIRDLSALNADIPDLISSAGNTIANLTNTASEDGAPETTDASRKEALETHTTAFYTGLQSLTTALRRHAYALEEAGIITAEAPSLSMVAAATKSQGPARPGAPAAMESERITNGGLGNLDIGWLNSRGNKVGAEKEAELIEEARALAEKVLEEQGGPTESEEKDGEGEGMDLG